MHSFEVFECASAKTSFEARQCLGGVAKKPTDDLAARPTRSFSPTLGTLQIDVVEALRARFNAFRSRDLRVLRTAWLIPFADRRAY
jgi:hypothetical protein